jgi:hypothetical protein
MRDFFKLFMLLFIPAAIFVLAGTYIVDRNRLRNEAERYRPQVVVERVIAVSKSTQDLRTTDLGQRIASSSAGIAQQVQKEVTDTLAAFDKSIQSGLAGSFGFSASGAELASRLMGWLLLGLLALAGLLSLFGKYAPLTLRQRLITGHNGAQARTGGSFELPH